MQLFISLLLIDLLGFACGKQVRKRKQGRDELDAVLRERDRAK